MSDRRALWWLWGAELASRVGEALFQITLLWYLVESVGSHLEVGLITMLGYLPALAVGAWAGIWVDRRSPRQVMLAASVVRAAVALGIPLLATAGRLPPLGVGGLAFGVATCSAFFNPARDAIIPHFARGPQLLRANSLVQSAWQVSLLIAPVLAALALPFVPTVTLFLGVGLAFAVSGLLLLPLPPLTPTAQGAAGGGRDAPSQPVTIGAALGAAARAAGESAGGAHPAGRVAGPGAFREGLVYLLADRRVFWVWAITAVNNFFLMGPVIVGMPIYVKAHLNGSGTEFALIEGAYAGGMILATWAIARWGGRWPPARLLFWGLIYDGLTYVPMLWLTSVPQTLVLVVIHSLGIPTITIGRLTALHRMVRPELRGRVFSYINLAVSGMTALSIGSVGIALHWLGIHQLFAVIGICCALCGVWGLALPHFWASAEGAAAEFASQPDDR